MRWFPRVLVLSLMFALAFGLLFFSLLTNREMRGMQEVYLRVRAGNMAGRLETMPPDQLGEAVKERIAEFDPALVDLEIFRAPVESRGHEVGPLWEGLELFRTEELLQNGERIFRAYLPFHSQSRLHLVRIDLPAAAGDFLVEGARHNLIASAMAGLSLLLLSFYAVWSAQRRTVLEKQRLELQHLARLGTMSAVLAHEIRNPLGTIKGFVQLASEQSDAKTAALLEPVIREAGRLERLASDLLMYGRPRDPQLRPVAWADVARELETLGREQAAGRPVRLVSETPDCEIETDPELLREALLNLLRNAIEAADREVRIAAVQAPDRTLTISIEDDGQGIPASVRLRLFEPFVTTKSAGTGLGLGIARRLVVVLGGRLALESIAPHGTRAKVILPNGKHSHHR